MNHLPEYPILERDFLDNTQELQLQMSALKKFIFDIVAANRKYQIYEIKKYSDYIKEYIEDWNNFAINVYDKMNSLTLDFSNFKGLPYSSVKEFIYSNYDYASMLQFADGCLSGLNQEKFLRKEDIDEFYLYSVDRGFKNRGETTAELLNEVIEDGNNFLTLQPLGDLEIKLFDNVRKYNIFNNKDKNDLLRSSNVLINFLCNNLKGEINPNIDTQLLIIAFSAIVDYLLYSLIAYSSRIYLIYSYAKYFVMSANEISRARSMLGESVFSEDELNFDDLSQYDEIIVHDSSKFTELTKLFNHCLELHNLPAYRLDRRHAENVFSLNLNSNILMNILTDIYFDEHLYNREFNKLNELVYSLKNLVYNKYQGLSSYASAKQELLNSLKLNPKTETVDGYKSLLQDLVTFSLNFLERLRSELRVLTDRRNKTFEDFGFNPAFINDIATCHKIIDDLYREFATAVFYRIQFINRKLYQLKGEDARKTIDGMKIHIDGLKSDISEKDTEMMGIPDTMRSSAINVINNIGALPKYENAALYYEYLKTLPECDEYFLEAIQWQTIFAQIKAFFDRLIEASRRLINNVQFKRAILWVEQNKDRLKSQADNVQQNMTMKCFKYKQKIDVNTVANALLQALENFKIKFNDNELVSKKEEYIRNLIDPFYNFMKLGTNAFGATITSYDNIKKYDTNKIKKIYKNWLLYDITSPNENDQQEEEFHQQDIRDNLDLWIANVLSATRVHEELIRISTDINKKRDEILNLLNSRANGSTTTQSAENAKTPPPINAVSTTSDKSNPQTAGGTETPQSTMKTNSTANDQTRQEAINKMMTALQLIWGDTYSSITNAITTQYKYIQEYNRLTTPQNQV